MMDNQEILKTLLEQLRTELRGVNAQPLIPMSVKVAVGTTFQILEILIAEANHGES